MGSLLRGALTAIASVTLVLGSASSGMSAESSMELRMAGSVVPVPCSDTRGCPDLGAAIKQTKIDRQTFSSTDCAVVEGEVPAGRRTLLRFTSDTPNFGPGALIVGKPSDHPEWFAYAPCHGHYHFIDYAAYRLWTPVGYSAWLDLKRTNPNALSADLLQAHPDIASQFVAGHKQGFCVIDVVKVGAAGNSRDPRTYADCFGVQGIGVGWADEYAFYLDGQWIDITDVASGSYVLEVETNAGRLYTETNYANNTAAVQVKVP